MNISELDNLIREMLYETIKKIDGKYVVYPKKGGTRLGTHNSLSSAKKQLAAIEASKAQHENLEEKSVPEPYNRNSPPRREMTQSQIAKRDKIGNAMLNNKSTVKRFKEEHGEEWQDYIWATASGIVLNKGE